MVHSHDDIKDNLLLIFNINCDFFQQKFVISNVMDNKRCRFGEGGHLDGNYIYCFDVFKH